MRRDDTEGRLEHLGRLLRGRAGEEIGPLVAEAEAVLRELAGPPTGSHTWPLAEALELLHGSRLLDRLLGAIDPGVLAAVGRHLAGVLEAPASPGEYEGAREAAHAWLDLVRRTPFLRRAAAGDREGWWRVILHLVEASRYTLPVLLEQRVEALGPRPLFVVPGPGEPQRFSWLEVRTEIDRIARGFLALRDDRGDRPVAILSPNRYEMALCDLALLASGIGNVMIPATATGRDVGWILRESRAGTVVAGDERQLRKVLALRGELPDLHTIILLDDPPRGAEDLLGLDDLVWWGRRVSLARLAEARREITLDDEATTMYTSGTTGTPKGIVFSHRNLVAKRFARGLALPELGENDVFLCYLPLYHTFGRWLELLGCLYWGATYVFLGEPSLETMLDRFGRFRPSVFISIPRKWMQLHEEILRRAEREGAGPGRTAGIVREVVGPRLRWGLSAAGWLSPEVFRFFQAHGVELMSGFGMTEATGGITMTPPGAYRDDTLGPPLPGIEVTLAPDGEMLIRGPYVFVRYAGDDPPPSRDGEGWFHTGDLMTRDEAGYYRIVDRKKEIYKNVKGQTIAPQRVENLFRDFDEVRRVFLVGDHRESNTLLIVPEWDNGTVDLESMTEEERLEHFRSLVVSVNRFLAPFERVVDFAVLPRDFSHERGELTPKGTYRRAVIVEHFADVIERMYRKADLDLPGVPVPVRVPSWLLQALGLTAADVEVSGNRVRLGREGSPLEIEPAGRSAGTARPPRIRVGSFVYEVADRVLDLGRLLAAPALWLGNEALPSFAPLERSARTRRTRPPAGLAVAGRAVPWRPEPGEPDRLAAVAAGEHPDLDGIDLAARALGAEVEDVALLGVRVLERAAAREEDPLHGPVLALLRSAARSPWPRVRRRAFIALLPREREPRLEETLHAFLDGPGVLLDAETSRELATRDLPSSTLERFLDYVREAVDLAEGRREREERDRIASLLRFLVDYGTEHPGSYTRLRWLLAWVEAFAGNPEDAALAARAREELTASFRAWLGAPQRVAVDPETGEEYRWRDVITFEEGMEAGARRRLLRAIASTALLREALFLFAGQPVRLEDIPPGGVWISFLGDQHGRAVYRVTVHTRWQGSHDFTVNVSHGLPRRALEEEILWLIVTGEERDGERLVENFGGFYPRFELWSEEFVAGETVDRVIRRLAREKDEESVSRLRGLWRFFTWSAAAAWVDFWDRTGGRYVIAEPSPAMIIVPTHDYQAGPRIVSVSSRTRWSGPADLLEKTWRGFVREIEERYPVLRGVGTRDLLFHAVLEVLGVERGLGFLRAAAAEDPSLAEEVEAYRARILREGFAPRRLHFAVERYRRWANLAPEATQEARARMIRELYDTYHLAALEKTRPETRVRFFRETVFRDAPRPVAEALDALVADLRAGRCSGEEVLDRVTALRDRVEAGSPEEYFLARLTFPHLRPWDMAGFVSTELGGARKTDVVVTLEDARGRPFHVRHPVSPREVAALHRLFLAAKLPVTFRPEHHYLVAVGPGRELIGGIFYEVDPAARTAHLEKIVVAERYRKLGVSDGLMQEFFHRLAAQGVETVTTGFFRPSYFFRFGFRIERRYAGLVKDLVPEPRPSPGSLPPARG